MAKIAVDVSGLASHLGDHFVVTGVTILALSTFFLLTIIGTFAIILVETIIPLYAKVGSARRAPGNRA